MNQQQRIVAPPLIQLQIFPEMFERQDCLIQQEVCNRLQIDELCGTLLRQKKKNKYTITFRNAPQRRVKAETKMFFIF